MQGRIRLADGTSDTIGVELGSQDGALVVSTDGVRLGIWDRSQVEVSIPDVFTLTIAGERWMFWPDDPEAFTEWVQDTYGGSARNGRDSTPIREAEAAEASTGPALRPIGSRDRWRPSSSTPALATRAAAAVALLVVSMLAGGAVAVVAALLAGAVATLGAMGWMMRDRTSAGVSPTRATLGEATIARQVGSLLGPRQGDGATEPPPGAGAPITVIKGIGPQFASMLQEMGIWTVADLAAIDHKGITAIEQALGSQRDRLWRERWLDQAAEIIDRSRTGKGSQPLDLKP